MREQTFRDAYRALLSEIYSHGVWETNGRTGVKVKMLRGGHSFKLGLSDGLPVAGNRRYWPHVAAAEVAWQFMGTRDPAFVLKHAPKLWSKFVEDGELKAAYGYRWREHFGRDQLALALEALRRDPSNRQVYLSAWDPGADGLGQPGQPKNIPCPVGFSLTRTGGFVHCSVFIRSSDVFVGLPYDVMAYALTLDAVAASLEARPGTLHVTLAHPHLYAPHLQATEDCLEGERSRWPVHQMPLPALPVEEVERAPKRYVDHVKRLADRVDWNPWNPAPDVIE